MIHHLKNLWPQRLLHQAPALVAVVMLGALLALHQISNYRLADSVSESVRQRALALANAAARSAQLALQYADANAAKHAMHELAGLPGVLRIDAFDGRGQPLVALAVAPHGAVARDEVTLGLRPPGPGQSDTERLRLGSVDAFRVWVPVGPGASHGTLALSYSQDSELAVIRRLRLETLVSSLVVGLMTVAVVYAFLVLRLQPLQRLAGFSRRLASSAGAQWRGASGSQELDELAASLNHTSTTLERQLDALRQAELRTHGILNAAPDAIVGLDDQGRISLANPAVTSIFGWDEGQVVGQPLSTLLPTISADEVSRLTLQGLFMRVNGSHVARLETEARRRDGTLFPAEVSLSRMETDNGPHYACVVRDITEQRMGFELLNLYSRALECTSNGVVISDMSLPGGPLFYANPAFARITGYDVSEAIGRNCKFLQGQDLGQPDLQLLRDAISQGESATAVLRNYRKDGTLFFNELAISPVTSQDGAVRHYVGVITDVTERERSRLALSERTARLNAVFDLSPDGYLVFDREGMLAYCNRAFRQMVGWNADDLTSGMSLTEFDERLRGQCNPALQYPPLFTTAQNGGESFDTVDMLELVSPRATVLSRLARCNVGAQGESILYFRDVTHETEVDRMKSEFLTTAAHELRTPMVSVFGFTELLLNRPVPEDRRRGVLEIIHQQSSLLISMVNELLDLARIEARQGKDMQREQHALGMLIERTVDSLMVQGDDRAVQLDVQHGAQLLLVDADKAVRALTNVLGNAYKYSPDGGEIRLHTLSGEHDGRPAVGVCVSDQGIGMSDEQAARVFERFFRADPSGNIPGTGLGMSLVKEIMALHGGGAELHSVPGQGTQVTLWFPLPDAATARQAPALLQQNECPAM